jgi:ArsR family transcriptional regulator
LDESQALAALGALSQGTRLPAGLSAGNIAERLGVIPSSLSFHLTNLVHAGLITQRRTGRLMIYAAAYDTMSELLAYLTENCCGAAATAAA